jgi:methyl-accepting chemotaxis protein-like sensor
VALAALLIAALFALTLVVTITRYESSLATSQRGDRQDETQRTVGLIRRNLTQRIVAVDRGLRDGRPEVSDLGPLRAEFDRLIERARTTGEVTPATIAHVDAADRASTALAIAADRALARNGTPDAGPAIDAYDSAVSNFVNSLRSFGDQQASDVAATEVVADRRAEQARWLAIGLGALALLVGAVVTAYAVRQLARVFNRIRRTAQTLNEASTEMRAAAVDAAAATSQQSAAIAQTARTIDELNATATSIAATAQTTASAAQQTSEVMEQGRDGMADIAERTLALGTNADRIGEILSLITEIAERTNLLALNAAIEASRAGDAGKGFAVVAGEVRKLAERSMRSSESIRDIVAALQDETNATILATEQGSKQINDVAELMRSTGEELEQTLRSTERQRAAAAQVSEAIADIRSAAEQLDAEQAGRLETAARVEELAVSLEATLVRAGLEVNGKGHERGDGVRRS